MNAEGTTPQRIKTIARRFKRSSPAGMPVLGDIKGGLVASISSVVFAISNGALIYSSSPQPMLGNGIEAGLLTVVVVSIVMALTSTFRPVVATASSVTAAPLGVVVATLAPSLTDLPPDAAIATISALVALTTVATGLLLVGLGAARLGKIVRFVPFPVLAGFISVTGTLFILGSVRVSTGVPFTWITLTEFLKPDIAPLFVAGFAVAAALLIAARFKNPLIIPGLLIATVIVVNAIVYNLGFSIERPPLPGFYLAPGALVFAGKPLPSVLTSHVQWHLIAPISGAIASYAVLVIMATLLTTSGLETALNVDADYNRELRAQGTACILSGCVGGFVGNATVGGTAAGVSMGAKSRMAGLVNGLVALAFLLFGLRLLPFVPRFVLGGFVAFAGLSIVGTWCIGTRRKMPLGEWALVLGIVAVTIWAGMVAGIIAGLTGGCVLFAIDISRLDIVRRVYGLNEHPSPLVRPSEELAILMRDGHRIRFLELRGTLFFGSAYQLFVRVKALVASDQPRMIVLDLTGVTGCDSTTATILSQIRRYLAHRHVHFATSGGRHDTVALLRACRALDKKDVAYDSRDKALEAAEELLLTGMGQQPRPALTLRTWLAGSLDDERLATLLISYLRPTIYPEGLYLCRQGEPTETLILIESGRVAVLAGPQGAERCVRVFGPFTIAGENGFVLSLPRTASLKVEREARVWILERTAFDRIRGHEPSLTIALMRCIIQLQSERLAFATRQNTALA